MCFIHIYILYLNIKELPTKVIMPFNILIFSRIVKINVGFL